MARTFLITGASGIGAETARLLARNHSRDQPVQIFFSSLTSDGCAGLREELVDSGAAGVEFLAGDLNDPDFPASLVRACCERFSRIDALFNVAGSSGRRFGDGPVHRCTEEGWQQTLANNLTTQFRMCHHAVNVMLKQERRNGERGAVLNMSSILALHPEPMHFDTVAYAASKGGILSMTRSMAASYADAGIRVNAILPALVRTPMSARASEDAEVIEFMRSKQALLGDAISAQDVASMCAFLLTPAARVITGQWIQVDAGWGL